MMSRQQEATIGGGPISIGELSDNISPDRVLSGFEKTQNIHLSGPPLSMTNFDI